MRITALLFFVLVGLIFGCSSDNTGKCFDFEYSSFTDEFSQYSLDSIDCIPFQSSADFNLGYYEGALWIKVSINNRCNEKRSFVIHNSDKLNRSYRFFDLVGYEEIPVERKQKVGISDDRSFNFPKPNFLVELEPGEEGKYLIYAESDGRMMEADLEVETLENYMQFMEFDTLKNFLFYGSALIILLINIFYLLIIRKVIYLFYVVYIITTCLFYLALGGYFYDRGIDAHLLDHLIFIIIRIWIISLLCFVFFLFDTRRSNPRIFAFTRVYMIVVYGGLTVYQFLFFDTSVAHLHYLENIIGICSLLIILSAAVFLPAEKRKETRYYLLAFFTFIIFGIIAGISSHTDWIPGAASVFLQVGTFLEFVVFTLTIPSAIKRSAREKQALETAIIRLKKSTRFEKKDVNAIVELLETNITGDKQWKQFKELYIKLDPDFFTALFQAYPELSKSELRLVVLIQMGFTQTEISDVLRIAPESVKKARQRLRSKWAVSDSQTLGEFLSKLEN